MFHSSLSLFVKSSQNSSFLRFLVLFRSHFLSRLFNRTYFFLGEIEHREKNRKHIFVILLRLRQLWQELDQNLPHMFQMFFNFDIFAHITTPRTSTSNAFFTIVGTSISPAISSCSFFCFLFLILSDRLFWVFFGRFIPLIFLSLRQNTVIFFLKHF